MNALKSYRLWAILAAVFQFLTGLIHGLSFFAEQQPANETEKQLMDLFVGYKQDLGAGYQRSAAELFIAVSACLTLLYLFGGMINWYLLRKKVSSDLMTGLLNIQVVVYGVSFAVMLFFAFLPPIVLTGLVFTLLFISAIVIRSQKTS